MTREETIHSAALNYSADENNIPVQFRNNYTCMNAIMIAFAAGAHWADDTHVDSSAISDEEIIEALRNDVPYLKAKDVCLKDIFLDEFKILMEKYKTKALYTDDGLYGFLVGDDTVLSYKELCKYGNSK